MAYKNNAFCWHGLVSTNVEGAGAFYTEVVGWQLQTVQMGDEPASMFAAAGIPRAHIMAPPMEGVPSHWDNYLRVQDVDASTAAAVANGGQQVVPPNDIPPGRFSVVTSPSGAMLCLFHEADPSAENAPAGTGSFHWVELHSQSLEADLTWLKSTFGFGVDEMPMPNDQGTYYLLKEGPDMVGGVMKAMMDQAPSMWLAWVAVDDVDAATQRVTNHGGKALTPAMDAPGIGRMGVIQAPDGSVLGLITPAS